MTPPPGIDQPADPPFALRRPRATSPSDSKHEAAAQRLAERRHRVRRIRKWVIGMSVAVFLAVWALIFANLVSGHDPALSKSARAAVSTQSNTSSGSNSSGSAGTVSAGSSGSGSSGGSASSGQSSSSSPSSVTTSQS